MTQRPYVCTKCGVSGVRLWREYNTFADVTDLECVTCAEKSQDRKYEPPGDSIGWRVPAVPVEGMDAFWGYGSVPDEGVKWWHSLPLFPAPSEGDKP
ncbi:MAG: hypothetical protein IT428_17540 [Planctomycetaceae bacterium]|nr:hypothetical protein [Planctomycetaceae bacterium]